MSHSTFITGALVGIAIVVLVAFAMHERQRAWFRADEQKGERP